MSFLGPLPGAREQPAEQDGHGRDLGADRLVGEEAGLLDDVADVAAQLDWVHVGDVACRARWSRWSA
jgi:hypothetical protein